MDTIVIRTAEDVVALARDISKGRRRRAKEIDLKLSGLPSSDAAEISLQLNKHYFSCGCAEATALGLAGFFGAIFWVASRTETVAALGWQDPALVIGAFLIGTGAGKAIGRLRARVALQASVDKLVTRVGGVSDIGKGDGSAVCAVR